MGYSSQGGQVILRSQAVQGTYQADTGAQGIGFKLRSGAMDPSRELMIPDPEIGGNRDVPDAYMSAVSWTGDYEFYARIDPLLTLLKAALGAPTSATTTGVTTHTYAPSDSNQLPFLSIEERVGTGLECYNYTDCVVNTLHLESDANGYVMGTVGIIGRQELAGATPTAAPVWDTSPFLVGMNVQLTYNSVALPAKSFTFDINNNFEDDDFRLGSLFIGDLSPKRREVTAGFTVRELSSAMWRQATYGLSTATSPLGQATFKAPLVIKLSSYENISGGTPATPYSLTITLPNFGIQPYNFGISADDIIDDDLTGQAFRPSSGGAVLGAVAVSGKTAPS